MTCWGYLKPNTPYNHIWENGKVVFESIEPIIPREHGAPLCYVVRGDALTEEQVNLLAFMLWKKWKPECMSIQQATDYIRGGLPLLCSWFTAVETDDLNMVTGEGAALLPTTTDFD